VEVEFELELKHLIANAYIDLRKRLKLGQEGQDKLKKEMDITVDIILLFIQV
jgi:hypothetical protein